MLQGHKTISIKFGIAHFPKFAEYSMMTSRCEWRTCSRSLQRTLCITGRGL